MKIYIFGSTGSGKTTIAKIINQKLHIPHFDIDQIFWKFEKGKRDNVQRERKILEILPENDWILEGMYRDEWLKDILLSANYIFILNPPKIILYWRIIKRTLSRMVEIENYERESTFKMLFSLLKTAKEFNKTRLPEFLAKIEKFSKKPIFIKDSKQILHNLNFD